MSNPEYLDKSGLNELVSKTKDYVGDRVNGKIDKPVNVPAGKVLQTDSNGNPIWGEAVPEASVVGAVENWLEANVDPGTAVTLDPTLTEQNAAAQAKATGDAIDSLKDNLVVVSDTQPSSADNKIWVPETQEDEVTVPTIEELNEVAGSVAKDYADLTFPIKAGTPCRHNYGLYYAKVDIPTTETWDSSHWSTKTHLANEVNSLSSAFELISEQTNLFNAETILTDKRLDSLGEVATANGCYTSDFIPVIAGQYYGKNSPVNDAYHRMAVYSSASDTAMISGQLFTENIVKIHADGKFIRICGLSTEVSTAEVKLITANDYLARKTADDAINALDNIKIYTPQINGMTPTGKNVTSNNLFPKATKVATGKYVSGITNGKAVISDNSSYDTYIIQVDGTSTYTFTDCRTAAVVSDLEYTAIGTLLSYAKTIDSTNGSYILFSFNPTTYPVSTYSITKPIPQYTIPNDWDIPQREDARINSLLGGNGVRETKSSVTGGNTATITTFPAYLKKNTLVSFYGKFSSFSGLLIGKGYNTYRGDWVEVTSANVIFHHYEENTDNVMQTDTHGITISDYIMVMMYLDADGKLNCSINSTGGTFSTYRQTNYDVFSGNTFATPTATMTDVELCVSNGDTRCPVWCIGDSYFGVNDQRVVGQLKNLGFWAGILFDGLAGLTSQNAYAELNRLLNFGMPKLLVWYLGMNDSNSDYLAYMTLVKDFCEENNITLVLNKVPTTPTMDKETIGGYVEASGCRYIDSYLAVGTNSSGAWYTGFLSTDNVHPTALGAKALAMRMVVDVPELAEYGYDRR